MISVEVYLVDYGIGGIEIKKSLLELEEIFK